MLEALLHRTGAVPRQGKVSNKSTIGDASTEARAHGLSVELNVATTQFMGDSYTFIDCPGSIEFAQDTRGALAGCDAAIVVCEADEKKAPALQLILKQLDELRIPRMLFVNKVDKSTSRPHEVLRWLQPASSVPLVLRQIPIWTGGNVSGFVDLALERAYVYREQAESEVVAIPADLHESEKTERFAMLEKLADHDDAMMEALLTDHEPPRDRVFQDLAQELADGLITPVLFGSAEHGNGIGRLLKALRHEVPDITQTVARLGLKAASGTTALILKTMHTERGGKLSLTRALAGELADGATAYGSDGQDSRIGGIFTLFGQAQTKVAKAVVGDTVALGRLEAMTTGETISTTKGATPQLINRAIPPGV
ncbi:MAG: GTP-binding protein, partial [Aestuariivirga sp.]